jgi:hypothetical protein
VRGQGSFLSGKKPCSPLLVDDIRAASISTTSLAARRPRGGSPMARCPVPTRHEEVSITGFHSGNHRNSTAFQQETRLRCPGDQKQPIHDCLPMRFSLTGDTTEWLMICALGASLAGSGSCSISKRGPAVINEKDAVVPPKTPTAGSRPRPLQSRRPLRIQVRPAPRTEPCGDQIGPPARSRSP